MSDDLARDVAERPIWLEGTASAWNFVLAEAREGYARVSMTVRADMLNGHAIAHGGMIFALADTAFAYACNSRNVSTVAQAASVVFLASATAGERLVAEAHEQALSGRSGVYAVTVSTADGRKIAEFQGLSRGLDQPVLEPS